MVPSGVDLMKLTKVKGNHYVSESRIGCLCHRPDETHGGQRQPARLNSGFSVAFEQVDFFQPNGKGNQLGCILRLQLLLL